jgi:hypothetical protein
MKKSLLFAAVATVLLSTSCSEKYLDQVNTNPTAASAGNLNPNYLLTDAQLTFGNTGYTQLLYPAPAIQGLASTLDYYGNGDKYINAGGYKRYQGFVWQDGYTPISRLTQAITVAQSQSADRTNLIAISNIMKVMIFQRITDTYGDVPFTQAAQAAQGVLSPQYDKQQDIYPALLTQLDAAIGTLKASGDRVTGDLIYGGDITKWKKLGYSLMVRLAMRMTKVNPALSQTWVEKAAAAGTMASYADNAMVQTDGSNGETQNATTGAWSTPDDFSQLKWSKTLIDYLRNTNDPRLGAVAEIPQPGALNNAAQGLVGDNTPSKQLGLPNGYDLLTGATNITNAPGYPGPTGAAGDLAPLGNYSRPRISVYFKRNAPEFVLTYAETEFLLAEAASRGWSVGATADTHYANGLRGAMQSMSQLDATGTISDAVINDYVMANPLGATDQLKQINEQYWVETCTTFNFLEAWFNWRRSGYPVLTPVNYPNNVTTAIIPRRMPYPSTEPSTNPTNYQAAVANLSGGDVLTSRVWWDK